VFTLLLDDTLKTATPLTNVVINETLRQFAPINNISQGSAATNFSHIFVLKRDVKYQLTLDVVGSLVTVLL